MRSQDDDTAGSIALSGTLPSLTVIATATTQTNFSVLYLISACSFAKQVKSLEAENEGKEFAAFWEEIFGYASATVLTTVAALESYINEFFTDAFDNFAPIDKNVLAIVVETEKSRGVLEKYDLALRLKNLDILRRGDNVIQNIELLVQLRHALVHFKPEWDNEQKEHAKLSKKLKHRFKGSPFLNESRLFPRAWASHDCCVWAIQSTIAFIEEFEDKTQSLKRLEKVKHRFIYK